MLNDVLFYYEAGKGRLDGGSLDVPSPREIQHTPRGLGDLSPISNSPMVGPCQIYRLLLCCGLHLDLNSACPLFAQAGCVVSQTLGERFT
jgi:hypothetical protein